MNSRKFFHNICTIIFSYKNFIKCFQKITIGFTVLFRRNMFPYTGRIAAFFPALGRKIKKICLIKVCKFIIPYLITSGNVNIIFLYDCIHISLAYRLTVFHMLTKLIAFTTTRNITDMSDHTINIVKNSLFFQIFYSEGIADILTIIIYDFRPCSCFPKFLLQCIAL